jgi:hypothetical protein
VRRGSRGTTGMSNEPRLRLTSDQIGDVGELLAALALSRPVLGRYKRPLFKPTHLGGKYPAADFLVDALLPGGHSAGFFFVQVKATSRVNGGAGSRLRLTADVDKLERLGRLPAPTYVVGVDLSHERSYLVAAFGRGAVRSNGMTRRYPLASEVVRIGLYREVLPHWTRRGVRPATTRFSDG